MKKYILIILVLSPFLSMSQRYEVFETIPKKVTDQDTLALRFETNFTYDACLGIGKNDCGCLVSIRDSSSNDTIFLDFLFDLSGIKLSLNGCSRDDTADYIQLDSGNYTVIGYWSTVDTTDTLYNAYRFVSDTFNFKVHGTATSLRENSLADLSIAPNPVKDQLLIKNIWSYQVQELQLWDVQGRKVRDLAVEEELDLSDLKRGIYLLKVIAKEGSREIKLLKE